MNINVSIEGGGGGSNPIFAHGKMSVFPFFPMGKNGKKVYGKKGKSIHFPLFPYTFFPIFPHGKKWENIHFSMGKNGVGPPPPHLLIQMQKWYLLDLKHILTKFGVTNDGKEPFTILQLLLSLANSL